MRVEDFATIFRDGGGVRVMLAWERLGSPEFGVTATYSRSPRLLGAMFTVWYAGPDGADADCWSAARPLRVAEAGRTEPSWPAERARRIAGFERAFREAPEPARLVLPAFALGQGALLLLDGNHRAVAAHRAGVPVRLLVYALRGPLREEILPDLRHHVG